MQSQNHDINQLAAAIVLELRRGGLIRPEYVDTKNAALFLGLSDAQLERWRSTGEGPPHIKHAKRVTYKVADLESWADARRIGGDR